MSVCLRILRTDVERTFTSNRFREFAGFLSSQTQYTRISWSLNITLRFVETLHGLSPPYNYINSPTFPFQHVSTDLLIGCLHIISSGIYRVKQFPGQKHSNCRSHKSGPSDFISRGMGKRTLLCVFSDCRHASSGYYRLSRGYFGGILRPGVANIACADKAIYEPRTILMNEYSSLKRYIYIYIVSAHDGVLTPS